MTTVLRKLAIRRVALVDAGANQEAFVNLFKRDDTMAEKKPDAERLAELEAQVAKLTKTASDAEAAKAKLEKEKADEIAKAAEAKKSAEDKAKEATDAVTALRKQLDTATSQVGELVEKAEIAKYAEIAKSVPHLGDGPTVRAILKGMPEKDVEAFLTKQRGLAEQLRVSLLFKEIGSNADGESDFGGKVSGIAKGLMEKDKNLTPEQAYVKALEQVPAEDYAAYRAGSYEESKRGGR